MVERKAAKVQAMFGSIAHRYDFLNHALSLSVDRWWRRTVRRRLAPLLGENARILDLCTGTADLAIELAPLARVVGCDFCHPMLILGNRKLARRRLYGRVRLVEGDALSLPFADAGFDAVTIAFGLRNLEDYGAGLREMRRVLRDAGALGILEFSQPRWPVFGSLYRFYFTRILPRVGRILSGADGPYSYLPESVDEFPDPKKLAEMLRRAGFKSVSHVPLTGGIATLHLALKGPASSDSPA